jgi:hypothetical protein
VSAVADVETLDAAMAVCRALKGTILDEALKEINVEIRASKGLVSTGHKTLDKLQRAKNVGSLGSGSGEASSSHSSRLMMDLSKRVTADAAGTIKPFESYGAMDVFSEFKKGAPVILANEAVVATAKHIHDLPYYAKQRGWLAKHIKSSKRLNSTACVMEKPALKSILSLIENRLGVGSAILASKDCMSFNKALEAVYEQQFYYNTTNFVSISFSPFCTAEVHLIIEGAGLILGFKASELPGTTVSAKAQKVADMSEADCIGLSRRIGFGALLRPGMVCIIPAGYLIIQVSSSESVGGLRWGLAADADADDTVLVRATVKDMLAAHPQLANSTLATFDAFLAVVQN